MTKRAAIYARVSTTNGQKPSNQLSRLHEVAEKAGWEIVEEFVDRVAPLIDRILEIIKAEAERRGIDTRGKSYDEVQKLLAAQGRGEDK